jgi:hypothetical protein
MSNLAMLFSFPLSKLFKKNSSCPKTYWVSGHLELTLRLPMKAIFL